MTTFTGTLTLLRFHLRRDRLMITWWVLGIVALYYSQAVSTDGLYATQGELDRAAAGMESNAAFIAMAGPARALDTVGGQVAWQATAFGTILAGLMSMFLIGRHTRAEEEGARDELVRSAVVGRHAPLTAAALVTLVANVLLGVLLAASLVSYGLPTAGSVVLGLATGLAGLVFGALALVAVQLASTTRAAYGMTGVVMGVAYVLRAVGDVGDGTLSWLSPIGWAQYMRPYAGESWWPALLSVGAVALLGLVAMRLFAGRDIGSGVLGTRPGPARGGLGSPFALAWRMQRGSVLGWTAAMALMGLTYGSIGDEVGDLVGDSQLSQDLFGQGGGSLVDSFYGAIVVTLALMASGFAIASVLRLRGEETDHYAELVLSTAVSRRRWASAHLAVTLIGTVSIVLASGIGLGLGFALVSGDASVGPRLTAATIQYVVPVLLLAALTWLAYGVRARWAAAGWLVLGFCAVVMLFGGILRMPDWLQEVSPFRHVALMPAEDLAVTPLAVLAVLVVLAGWVGMVRLERRDIG